MASLGATYDASQGDQMSDRSVLPAGEYLAAIAKSDVSDTTRRATGARSISSSRCSTARTGAAGSGAR